MSAPKHDNAHNQLGQGPESAAEREIISRNSQRQPDASERGDHLKNWNPVSFTTNMADGKLSY